MTRTVVIAEMGSCHDGDLEKAKRLIDTAKDCGADIVKAQFWSSADRLADRRKVPDHYRAIYRRYQLPREWLPQLKAHADARGIEFMCTTYLPEDVEVIAPFVQRFKISSFERADWPFVAAHARFNKPLIISCGMEEPGTAYSAGFPPRASYLHCVSGYPTPLEQANLAYIQRYNKGFSFVGGPIGFSDHTGDPRCLAGAFAVCAGATIIEVHFQTRETDRNNPDAGSFALTPMQLRLYIENIRHAEKLLGDGVKRVQQCELENSRYRVTA